MLGSAPLQLWFDLYPDGLGVGLIFIGLEVLLLGSFQMVFEQRPGLADRLTIRERAIATGALVLGILLSGSAVVQQYELIGLYTVYLVGLGKLIQGAATARFYHHVVEAVKAGRIPKLVIKRVKRGAVVLLGLAITGWVVMELINFYTPTITVLSWFPEIWTVIVLLTASYGVLRDLRFADEPMNTHLKIGFVTCITGTAVYNGATEIDLAAFGLGLVVYTLAFWLAIVRLFGST